MDDRDFFDVLHQLWTKTTDAEDRFWQPLEYVDGTGRWKIYAVGEDETERKLVASELSEIDADFITAIHGCLPDLVRRLHMAVDESDSLDLEKDDLVIRIAELEQQADQDNAEILRLAEFEWMYKELQ